VEADLTRNQPVAGVKNVGADGKYGADKIAFLSLDYFTLFAGF
jgi:hypothetical protein